MELIISILFFALASAVCIQLFVKAHLLGQDTILQNKSIMWCQNLAELFVSCEGRPEDISAYLTSGKELSQEHINLIYLQDNEYTLRIFFNEDFAPCPQDSTAIRYIAELSCQETANGLLGANISFQKANLASQPLIAYQLHLEHHVPITLKETEVTAHE